MTLASVTVVALVEKLAYLLGVALADWAVSGRAKKSEEIEAGYASCTIGHQPEEDLDLPPARRT